jgi:hypothetical protein
MDKASALQDAIQDGGRQIFIVLRLLYEYDRWANNRVLRAASALSAEEFKRDLGGSFRSVRDTLVHIIGGEWSGSCTGRSRLTVPPS